jgi:CheY-like chemotaxis protein
MINSADILQANILIVDDEEANVLLLERTLRGAGYISIESTTNSRKVCELYRKNRYDLIILDIRMPGMDGFQVMEGLREIEFDDDLPVLVITAEPGHKQRALQAGAKDFISKPFELVEVLTRVHNMLEARLLHKETVEHQEDNPALSSVIERNIRQMIQLRLKSTREQKLEDRIAVALTSFSGRMLFLYVHILWFGIWILCKFQHYGLLSLIVSLEAILLSTVVLISQNLLSQEAKRTDDLSLQTGLLTEHELTRVLQMLHAIQGKIGISNDENRDLADAELEKETNPEEVLAEIERLQRRAYLGR